MSRLKAILSNEGVQVLLALLAICTGLLLLLFRLNATNRAEIEIRRYELSVATTDAIGQVVIIDQGIIKNLERHVDGSICGTVIQSNKYTCYKTSFYRILEMNQTTEE